MSEIALWATSGAMALTGRPDGPPQAAPGRPASAVDDALTRIRMVQPRVALPDVRLLGERAAAAGLHRNAPWSCGGAFRVLACADGLLGLSLPRSTDLAAVPALIEAPIEHAHTADGAHGPAPAWAAAAAWAARTSAAAAVARARLLDLAACVIPTSPARPDSLRRAPVVLTPGARRRPPAGGGDRPLVIDFTSLWAGPLCAHLLSACGADVVKVEATTRLDGAREGSAAFFDLLHSGHRSVTVDFSSADQVARLRDLVATADLVLEASRPRALRRLGIVAEQLVAAGTSWLSITAYGRESDAVGFGDDVAAGAGLLTADVSPCGDALADPLAGVTAAAYAVEALHGDTAVLVDLSMHHVAAAAGARGTPEPHDVHLRDGQWWVECDAGLFAVAEPAARPAATRAAAAGQHNELLESPVRSG